MKAFIVGFIVGALLFGASARTQERTSWVFKDCQTNDCIRRTLGGMSTDQAHSAKLTTWGSTTYVWYRQ